MSADRLERREEHHAPPARAGAPGPLRLLLRQPEVRQGRAADFIVCSL